MKKRLPIISFENTFLHKLVEDKNSCVELQEQKYHLALHPYHLTNINSSIKDLLGQGIAKYDQKLGGILLGYENIKLLSEGTIVDDSFFVHIDVGANFFLFKPEVGKDLVGVVNKKSEDHVGCLVYETFNVSIPKPEEEDVSEWMGSSVKIGDEILFKVTVVKLETRLPYIKGELLKIPDRTNDVDNSVEDQSPKKKAKHKKSKKRAAESFEDETEECNSKKRAKIDSEDERIEKKKSKRKSRDSESSSPKKRSSEVLVDVLKKKHKKSRKEKVTIENEGEDVSRTSLKSRKNEDLINGDIEDHEHKRKKKKKKKDKYSVENNTDEVNSSFNNTMSKTLLDDSDVIDNDLPRKKKKKKKDKLI